VIRRLTGISLAMIAGLCCPYNTSNEFERCHSFFARAKKRLVTRNHLALWTEEKKGKKLSSINRFQLVSCH
jgi:hypothetical protein